jgi:L-alanine-DL-glutamate epimerase-like enolase superfamily enzyme
VRAGGLERLAARAADYARTPAAAPPVFVEEPLRPELSDQIGRITSATTVPVATGERLYSREEFRPEEAVRRAGAIGHRFRSPIWRHPDGSFAEW